MKRNAHIYRMNPDNYRGDDNRQFYLAMITIAVWAVSLYTIISNAIKGMHL